MAALCIIAFQILLIIHAAHQIQKTYHWSWLKFSFPLLWGLTECAVILVPAKLMNTKGPYFVPVFTLCIWIAILNVFLFIYVVLHWKLPDGRNSLEVMRDERRRRKQEKL